MSSQRDRESSPPSISTARPHRTPLRMIATPEKTLGKPAMAALHEIRNRIPLDFYGIDFDMLPDGRVLFFEANAAMNLSLSDAPVSSRRVRRCVRQYDGCSESTSQ